MPRKGKYTATEKADYYRKKYLAEKKRKAARPRGAKGASGHGAYTIPKNFFNAKRVGGMLGSAGGAAIGNMLAPGVGAELGSMLGGSGGEYLGRLFKQVTGWGDYTVKQNSLLFADEVVPSFGEDSIRVKKREFIADINSVSSVFTLHSFPINPGLDTSFPWLSAIARNYEQYRINGMIFQFVSTSSDAIASTTALGLGQVILATDYNAADEDFQDATQMLNFMFSNSAKPSDHIMHAIECAPTDQAQQLYYVRTGDVPSGQDARLYDLGKFQIAVNNMPASYNGMGQLWVSYDVTFCKSVQNNELGFALNSDQFHLTSALTNSNPFGDGGTVDYAPQVGSSLGCVLNNTTIYFPDTLFSGYYKVSITWTGTAAAVTAPTITPANCNAVLCWTDNTLKKRNSPNNTVSTTFINISFVVKLGTTDNSTQPTLAFAGASLPTSLTACDVCIDQINGDIYDEYVVNTTSTF